MADFRIFDYSGVGLFSSENNQEYIIAYFAN